MGRTVTVDEFRAHTDKDNLWVLLHEKVYDISKFIDEHPGGDEVVLAEAGTNATDAFEDIGHSDEARALLPDMFVGELEDGGLRKLKGAVKEKTASANTQAVVEQGSNLMYFAPITLLVAYFAYRFYTAGITA